MAANPPPGERPPQPPAPNAERPADDDWRPYRPTPWPAPVMPDVTPPPGHHIPQHDDRAPYAGPPQDFPPLPPAPQQPPPPRPPMPGPGRQAPYGAGFGPVYGPGPPPPAFAPPLNAPLPPPPAFAPPIAGPQPPPPAPGLLPPQFEPQFERSYEPRYEQPQPPGGGAEEIPPRPGRRKRRLIELGVLLILLPAVLGVRWYDDSNLAVTRDPHQHVTVVPRGAWAKLGNNQWRMLGRQEPNSAASSGSLRGESPPGSAELILLLEVKVLAAQGAKDLGKMQYKVRDREGHVWSADGAVQNQSIDDADPAPGNTQRVRVTATVPQGKLSSAVLDLHIQPFDRPGREVLEVLRFAH
jgi:hypothetical protein